MSEGYSSINWGRLNAQLRHYVATEKELLTLLLDDLDNSYEIAPTTEGLDYTALTKGYGA